MIPATCILITKEKQYPQEILDSLPEFDEVIIKTECPSVLMRYELAKQAKNDIIYVQDDDCIADVEFLWERYAGKITNAMTEGHYRAYWGSGITLIGWGTFFPKSMVNFDEYIDVYGITLILLSQADRVFTYLNQPFDTHVLPIHHLPSAVAVGRMSTSNDHWSNLETIKKQLYELSKNNHNRQP